MLRSCDSALSCIPPSPLLCSELPPSLSRAAQCCSFTKRIVDTCAPFLTPSHSPPIHHHRSHCASEVGYDYELESFCNHPEAYEDNEKCQQTLPFAYYNSNFDRQREIKGYYKSA